jgi:quinol monooxygenase YgiN
VVDARNGFEDVKEDVEWGFSEFLPRMSKTDCKYVVFIMNEVNEIEGEMDLWTKEFGKYFTVIRAVSYEAAIKKMKESLLVNVTYKIKEGKREEFFNKVNEMGIIEDSRQEPGNSKYEYFFPVDSEDKLFLMEMWANDVAQAMHGKTEHYKKLQLLKEEYVIDVSIEKYNISKL